MNGSELLNDMLTRYPKEKPVVFNYAQARAELLSLADRILELETLFGADARDKSNI